MGGNKSFAVHFIDLTITQIYESDKYNSDKLQEAFPIEYKWS